MAAPSISVILPCFNGERFVGDAIASVLAQGVAAEVIVVDDGSTDRSAAIVRGFEGVRLVSGPRKGAAAARNAGLASASGSRILFMDCDDLIVPGHLQALSAALAGAPADAIAFSPWVRFHGDPRDAKFPERPTERDLPGVEWVLQDWAQAQPMTQCGMFLLPRSLLARCGGWNEQLSLIDDFEFFARLIPACGGMRFAPQAGLYYRSGVAGSLSGAKSRQAVESAFRALMLGTGHLLRAEDSPRTRRACANLLQQFDYENFPHHRALRAQVRRRVAELGGADVAPVGPPNFHRLRRVVGWRTARLVQHAFRR